MKTTIRSLASSLLCVLFAGLGTRPATASGQSPFSDLDARSARATGISQSGNNANGSSPRPLHRQRPPRQKSDSDGDPKGLPTFTRCFEWKGQQYTVRFVGSDPAGPAKTTTINALIVPLRLDFGNGVVMDADHDLVDGLTVLDAVLNSPVFRGVPFTCGSTTLGNTQYCDAYLRANFWSEVKNKPGYHALLHPTVFPSQTLVVPAGQGFLEDNVLLGVNADWIYDQYISLLAQVSATPDEVVIFLLAHEVAVTDSEGNFIGAGEHFAVTSTVSGSGPAQTFLEICSFSATDPDWSPTGEPQAEPISHEILEWFNDPYVDNGVPPWPFLTGEASYILETCDYLVDSGIGNAGSMPVVGADGHTYYLAEGVFFDWFTRAPLSRSVNGWYSFKNSATTFSFDCTYDNDKFASATLDYPGAVGTYAKAINNRGDIVGHYRSASGAFHGFLNTNGTFQTIDVPGAIATYLWGINDLGQISGYFSDGTSYHGFTFINGQFATFSDPLGFNTRFGKINNRGEIAGFSFAQDGSSPLNGFVFKNGEFHPVQPPFGPDVITAGINDRGDLVGTCFPEGSDDGIGFIGSGTNYRHLDYPAASTTYPCGISNQGVVAGYIYDGFGWPTGIYKQGNRWLHVSYGGFTIPDWLTYTGPTYLPGVNDKGDAVGYYFDYADYKYHGLVLHPLNPGN